MSKSPFVFECEQWLPRPIEEVFPFFAHAHNLQQITPPWLNFHVLTPAPIPMKQGTLIDYKLRVRFIPMRWQTEITEWQPPHRFVDEQRRGPYRLWHHVHTFESREGGTLVRDHVDYRVPGGWLIERLFVRRDIRKIFAYRRSALEEIFGEAATPASAMA